MVFAAAVRPHGMSFLPIFVHLVPQKPPFSGIRAWASESAHLTRERAFSWARRDKRKKIKKGIDKLDKMGYNNRVDYATGVHKVRGDVLKRPKRRPC